MSDCIPSVLFGLRRLVLPLLLVAWGAIPVSANESPTIFESPAGHGDCETNATGEVVCSSCNPGWGGETCQICLDPRLCGPKGYGQAAISHYSREPARQWASGVFPGTVAARSFRTLEPVDAAALLDEDRRRGWENRWGVILDAGLHSDRNGRWVDQANGGRVWTAALESTGASLVTVLFDQLTLVPDAELWVYSERSVHGPVTARHLRGDSSIGTAPLWGDRVVIEVYDPPAGGSTVGSVHLVHGYRDLAGTQEDCQVDVACYAGAENVANSVAYILQYGDYNSFVCTGAMINSPGTGPYLLTAEHCLFHPSDYFEYLKDPEQDASGDFFFAKPWSHKPGLVFQYRNQECKKWTDDAEVYMALTYFGDFEVIHHDHETDTALVEVLAAPSPQCVTYAGYDARGDHLPNYTAGISHPDGKLAKLSIDWQSPAIIDMEDDDPQINAIYVEEDTVWRVELEVGYLEGGSSGSPLFDHTGRIVGALSGRIQQHSTYCDQSTDFVYGRLSRAFDLDPTLYYLFDHRKMDDAGSTVSFPTPLQTFGPFDACVGMTNTYGVNPKVGTQFEVEWELLSSHGSIVGPANERQVQVYLGWQATEVKLRVTVRSTDPSCPYQQWDTVTYNAYGCKDGP